MIQQQTIPKVIILDLKLQLDQFEQEIAPFILGTEYTAKSLIDMLWEALFDKALSEEMLVDTVVTIARSEELQHATAKQRLADVVSDLAAAIRYQVELHGLYFDRGCLPYSLEVDQYKNVILRLDEQMDKMHKAWQDELAAADEDFNDEEE